MRIPDMESTFAMIRIFPPPTSGTDIFAWLYSPCTRLAANAWETLVMKLVVWHPILMDIILDLFFRPHDERIEFQYIIIHIVFHHLHRRSRYRLAAPKTANPDLNPFQGSFQRFHLADIAT